MLEKLLRSKDEVKILGIALFQDGLHLREIARRAGISAPQARRELSSLVEIGLLKGERKGNMLIFSRNLKSPIFPSVRELYLRTEGIFEKMKGILGKLEGVKYAFVFGSMALGKERSASDIDLMVIGEVDGDLLAREIFGLQKGFSREINFICWNEKDLREKIKSKSPFLKNVLRGRLAWLAGDKDGFARAVEKRGRAKN